MFGGLKAIAKLALSNGTDYKIALDSAMLNGGTYELEIFRTATLPATAVAYSVKVKMNAPIGKVLVDEMGLYMSPVLRSAETSLSAQPLPLPGISGASLGAGGPGLGQGSIAQSVIAGIPGQ